MEVIQGISQIMANTYDGAKDEKGNPIKVGLRREENKDFRSCDCRFLDGFRARVTHYADSKDSFPCLIISYQSEVKLQEAHNPKLAEEVQDYIGEALKYLKKEFKKITKKELSVEKHGEMKMLVEELSKVRTQVTAVCHYKISDIDMAKLEDEKETKRAAAFEKWLALGGLKK